MNVRGLSGTNLLCNYNGKLCKRKRMATGTANGGASRRCRLLGKVDMDTP